MPHTLSVIGTGPSHWQLQGINSRRFSPALAIKFGEPNGRFPAYSGR